MVSWKAFMKSRRDGYTWPRNKTFIHNPFLDVMGYLRPLKVIYDKKKDVASSFASFSYLSTCARSRQPTGDFDEKRHERKRERRKRNEAMQEQTKRKWKKKRKKKEKATGVKKRSSSVIVRARERGATRHITGRKRRCWDKEHIAESMVLYLTLLEKRWD